MISLWQLPYVLTTEERTRNIYRITLAKVYSAAQLRRILVKVSVNAFFFKNFARLVLASISCKCLAIGRFSYKLLRDINFRLSRVSTEHSLDENFLNWADLYLARHSSHKDTRKRSWIAESGFGRQNMNVGARVGPKVIRAADKNQLQIFLISSDFNSIIAILLPSDSVLESHQ